MNTADIPVFILCGGLGTRIKEEAEFRPKPMVPIGEHSILWHVMRIYAQHGFRRFVLGLGFKADVVKDYFRNFHLHNADCTIKLKTNEVKVHESRHDLDWEVTLAYTGEKNMTGSRVVQAARKYLGDAKHFAVTYGDGLTDANLAEEFSHHLAGKKLGTVLGVNPPSRFGEIKVEGSHVIEFAEKPDLEGHWINGGFFFFHHDFLKYLTEDESCVLERGPLVQIARRPVEYPQTPWLLGVHGHATRPRATDRARRIRKPAVAQIKSAMFAEAFQDKTVWLSGHTGFKSAWRARWLTQPGARVHGFALPPATTPSVFEQFGLAKKIEHEIADVCDAGAVKKSILHVQPDFVFHLAAQALVRYSYEHPLETYATNVMGTAHVLEALRSLEKPCAAVIVTTDKCYENREKDYACAEEDHLGGHDPYSSSKGAAEIVTSAYRRSFFGKSPVRIARARAGNVIGGGDWAPDRIVPDCIRALQRGEAIPVRNKPATRPWQHVLEPLSGYLWLATALAQPKLVDAEAKDVLTAFNFSPEKEANRTVVELVGEILKSWPGRWDDRSDPKTVHEAKLFMLSTAKAKRVLHWQPTWKFETASARMVEWYRGVNENAAAAERLTLQQIAEYENAARAAQTAWATK